MTYIPLFKKIQTNSGTGAEIIKIQLEFEKFWMPLNKRMTPNAEKSLGMRRLQESCMWLCRSAASSGGAGKTTSVCAQSELE